MVRVHRIVPAILIALSLAACAKDPEVAHRDHLQKGDAFFAKKEYQKAQIQYRNALKALPRSGETMVAVPEIVIPKVLTAAEVSRPWPSSTGM